MAFHKFTVLEPVVSESSILMDQFDLDPQIIAQLQDIFPYKSRLELVDIAKDHKEKSLEELVELVFELETQAKEFPTDVYKIYEIVPSADLETIHRVYRENGEDFEKTLSQLVEPSECSTGDPCRRMCELLGVTKDTASKYLAQNGDDFVKALIDLVLHEEVDVGGTIAGVSGRGSRVQKWRPSHEGVLRKTADLSPLHQLYEESEELQALSKKFLESVFILVEADIVKLLNVVTQVRSNGYEELTYIGSWQSGKELPKLKNTGKWAGPTATGTRNTDTGNTTGINDAGTARMLSSSFQLQKTVSQLHSAKDKRVKAYYANELKTIANSQRAQQAQEEASRAVGTLNRFKVSNRVDLHNYQVATAIQIVKQVLSQWWNTELDERVAEGKLNKYGHQAQFVDHVELVTGRGIHSAGGVAKIKPKVGKFLAESGYIYTDATWGYIVTGKRT